MTDVPPRVKALAAIGNVCLQYSLLEHMLAVVNWALLDLDEEIGAIVTGGADMKARLGMAIALAEQKQAPYEVKTRLKSIRKTLKDKDLVNRRNQAVHGAQKTTGLTTTFTMLRWSKPRREQQVSLETLHNVGVELNALSEEAYAAFRAIGKWRFGEHYTPDSGDDLSGSRPVPRLKFAQRLYARLDHLWRKLSG